MAYLRDIKRFCRDCNGRASVELVNAQNAVLGAYCKKDGDRRLKALQRSEAKPDGRP